MKNFLMLALIFLLILAVGWFVWSNWGSQLSDVPGQISGQISRMLTGIMGSLAGFGASVRDSFRMPGR
jgi:hypothetical protein